MNFKDKAFSILVVFSIFFHKRVNIISEQFNDCKRLLTVFRALNSDISVGLIYIA
jgi:hypothetical protein